MHSHHERRAEYAAFAPNPSNKTRNPSNSGALAPSVSTTDSSYAYGSRPATSENVLDMVVRTLGRAGALTPVRMDVLRLALLGRQYREIAAILGKSPNTVATQIKSILRALGADSTRDLFRVFLNELDQQQNRQAMPFPLESAPPPSQPYGQVPDWAASND